MFKGSIVALITPFNEEGGVDFNVFEELITWHVHRGTDAIVICGITGEAPTLSVEEQGALICRAVSIAKGKIPIIAGTGCASTHLTVQLTKQAKEAGADACMVIVPYCNRPTPQGCIQHYEAVSKVGLPMIVYHHPSRTMVRLSISILGEILSLSHVIGVKEGSGDLVYTTELIKVISIPIFGGDDILILPMMSLGAQGVISIVANLIPQEWKELCALLLKGDFNRGRALFRTYQPLVEAMILETNPQCVKYALSLMGKSLPFLRAPMMMPQEGTRKKIEHALEDLAKVCEKCELKIPVHNVMSGV